MTKAAEILQSAMLERQITNYRLAKMTGITESGIWRIVNSRTKPTYRTAVILATALGIEPYPLLADSEPAVLSNN